MPAGAAECREGGRGAYRHRGSPMALRLTGHPGRASVPGMERFFNTEGPCEPSRHYMLPPLDRLPTIGKFIDRGKYLVVHAPRQVGKTTALSALARKLTAEGRY